MLPPMQVLLVEDNPINQKVAQRLLEKAGHTVTVADNGKVAVDTLESRTFDVVLMDVSMPEMDGLEATAVIRQREAGQPARMPIVAFTAHAMVGDREKCLAAGMDSYVTKPVQPTLLFQAMADAVAATRRAG
ncbi:MAG: response regulator [Gemmataceae bacterium]|nr:response regulator [Gemmataceae bacterium]